MQPLDYTSAFQGIQQPGEALYSGYRMGAAMREDEAMLQARQQAMEAERQKQAAQQRMQADLHALSRDPTPENIARTTIMYPHLSESFKRTHDMLAPEQQRVRLENATQVYAAVESGRPDVARDLLEQQAVAMENSGKPREAGAARMWAQMIEKDPRAFKANAGLMLSSVMGDKFGETFAKLGDQKRSQEKHPADVDEGVAKAKTAQANVPKAVADAQTAQVTAANAGTAAELDNETKARNIKTQVARLEIDREDNRIRSMEAVFSREGNELKREELSLKIDTAKAELEKKRIEVGEAAQAEFDTASNGLDTIKRIRAHPGMKSGFASGGIGTMAGSSVERMPGSDRKDLANLVQTMRSQQFLAAIPKMKGMGQLTEQEGKRLETAAAMLDLDSSPDQFRRNLSTIEDVLKIAQAKAVASGRLPTSGGAVLLTHPKYGAVTEGRINSMMAATGATREQVLQYLEKTRGGQ